MAKNDNLTDFLTDIASEIRAQTGNYKGIDPQDFSQYFALIDSLEEKDVNFYDIDGKCIYAYTWEEFESMQELPEIPIKNRGGISISNFKWNYTLDEIKAQKVHHCDVGVVYSNEKYCYFIVNIPSNNYTVSFSGTIHSGSTSSGIDWGDGTVNKSKSHVFNAGTYCIKVDGYCEASKYISGGILPKNIVSEAYIGILAGGQCDATRRLSINKTGNSNYVDSISYNSFCPCLICGSDMQDTNDLFYGSLADKIILNPTKKSLTGLIAVKNIKTLCIPEGVTYISGLSNCLNLKKIYCPSTITEINTMGSNCRNLKVVDFSVSTQVPAITNSYAFQNTLNCSIIVPDNLYDEWITSYSWPHIISLHNIKIIKASEYTEQ